LVIFQFAVTGAIILGTLVAHNQLRYIRNKPLGYDTEAIVTLPLPDDLKHRAQTIKQEVLRLPGVESASIAGGTPIHFLRSVTKYKNQKIEVTTIAADADYLESMGMHLIAGRGFKKQMKSDSVVAVVVNETAARIFDLHDDVDEPLRVNLAYGSPRLVGIVSDFHTASMHKQIEPTVIYAYPYMMDSIVLRLNASDIASTIEVLEETWSKLAPTVPFEYHFLDESLEKLYRNEAKISQLSTVVAFLSLFIACMGLFALSAFAA